MAQASPEKVRIRNRGGKEIRIHKSTDARICRRFFIHLAACFVEKGNNLTKHSPAHPKMSDLASEIRKGELTEAGNAANIVSFSF
jgi:hypothetical protein